jgi:hypothetical protein
MLANFFRDIGGNRAGVGLFLGDTVLRQQVNNGFRLDLQLASQLINSDLIDVSHTSLGLGLF